MKQSKSLVLFVLLFSFDLRAAIGVGGFTPFLGVYQSDKEGGDNTFDLKPLVSVVGRYHLFGRLYLRPELGHVFSYKTNKELNNNQHVSYTFALLNAGIAVLPHTFFNFGIGTFWHRIQSIKGQKKFNNGNSTATYFYPEGSVSSVNSTLNIGIEQALGPISFSLMTYFFQIAESQARSISYGLTLNYFI